MAKQQRTDPHRPGAIIPANYTDWNSYSLASGMVPAIGVDCAQPYAIYDEHGAVARYEHPVCPDTGRCCVRSTERHARAEGRAIFGAAGKCGVCGAHYVYGSMFRHDNGEIVHMGHDCADKYGAMYDLSSWEVQNNRVRAATAKAIKRAENDSERAEFLAAHAGLAEDLLLGGKSAADLGIASDDSWALKGHAILADLASKFVTYRTMSDKQIALASKLAEQIRNPAPKADKPVEIKATAPTGKGIEFEGEIVSVKLQESEMYGSSWKCTIKVTTDAGVWLAWGSVASSLMDRVVESSEVSRAKDRCAAIISTLKGMRVEVKATLEASTGNVRTCDYCAGRGTITESDWSRTINPTTGKYDAIEHTSTCGSCKGTGRVGRIADPSFAFMKRPSMTVAGIVSHPVYKAPRKAKKASESTEV